MTKEKLKNLYFDWLCNLIKRNQDKNAEGVSYSHLLFKLQQTEFTYINPMDDNRAIDGMDLRYRFGYENDISSTLIAVYLDRDFCSVLEMLVALSMHCEQIMDNAEGDNSASVWFWDMIFNLGLDTMDDSSFNESYVDRAIYIFLNRKYAPDGKGGLFPIKNCKKDLRTMELWVQMCWYLDCLIE